MAIEEETEKVQNGKEILDQIKDLKSKYESKNIDRVEEEFTFLDKVNKLIQLILNDNSFSVYEVLEEDKLKRWHKNRIKRWLKGLFANKLKSLGYLSFLVFITGFLVSQSVNFYAGNHAIVPGTYVKAILTEISFIFLSGYNPNNKLQAIGVNFLRVGIFGLMMFVISAQTISNGTKDISQNEYIDQQIVLIKKEIQDKDKQIVYYKDVKNWPVTSKQLIKEKDKLVNQLIELQKQEAQGHNKNMSKVEKYKIYGRAFFRILLLFISVLISRRMFSF